MTVINYITGLFLRWGSNVTPASTADPTLSVLPRSDVNTSSNDPPDLGVNLAEVGILSAHNGMVEILQKMDGDDGPIKAIKELNKIYSRLSPSEKDRVNDIFWKVFEKGFFCPDLDKTSNIRFSCHTHSQSRIQLGSGTFGQVFEAHLNGRAVAVKILRKSDMTREIIAQPRTHKHFFREIKMWCSITESPHVMRLVGYYFDARLGEIGFITPLAQDNLRQWSANNMEVSKIRKYDLRRLKYLVEAARGLHHLHQVGVVHGDLRASNVLLEDDMAKIADFGISKLDEIMSSFSMAKDINRLAKAWLAPELINCEGASRTKNSDLFAFARMIIEVYTGGDPFRGEIIADLKAHICNFHHPVRPEGIDDEVWKTMEQYWAKNPRDRGTAEDVIRCIERLKSREVLTNEVYEEPDDADIFPIES